MTNSGKHLYVSGEVQGVGFRYSAIRLARAIGVTGWVRNLYDGRVELWIEGEESRVNQMVEWCYRGPRGAHVTDVDVEICAYSGQYPGFDVGFD